MRKIFLLFLFITYGCNISESNKEPEKVGAVDLLQIETSESDYISLLENKVTDFAVPCRIIFKGQVYYGAVSALGAGSRYHEKWGYKIKLNDGALIYNLNTFNLSSTIYDKTGINTAIAIHFYKKLGFPTHNYSYCFVKFNGKEKGLYPIIERIEDDFFVTRNLPVFELYKIGFETKFTFANIYIPEYNIEKKIPKDNNYNSLKFLINAIDTCNLTNNYLSLNKFLDVNNYIKYHALTVILNNQDAFTNNFYLYKSAPDKPFSVIPWDFDKAFLGDVGLYGENELINKLISFPITKKLYLDTMKDILNNTFTLEDVFKVIDENASKIKEAYNKDPYLGKNRYNFDSEINKLKQYIINRRNFLLNSLNNI